VWRSNRGSSYQIQHQSPLNHLTIDSETCNLEINKYFFKKINRKDCQKSKINRKDCVLFNLRAENPVDLNLWIGHSQPMLINAR
jgi:hypothetical protein